MLLSSLFAVLLSFLASAFNTAPTGNPKASASKDGRRPHPEDARAVFKLVSAQAFNTYTDHVRASADHYKQAYKIGGGNPRRSYPANMIFGPDTEKEGHSLPIPDEDVFQGHMRGGSDAMRKADYAAKTSRIIASTIKGIKLPGTGSKHTRDALRLVATHTQKKAEDEMIASNYHKEQAAQVRGFEDWIPGDPSRDLTAALQRQRKASKQQRIAQYRHSSAHYRTFWRARDAAATNRQIASVVKDIPPDPRMLEFSPGFYINLKETLFPIAGSRNQFPKGWHSPKTSHETSDTQFSSSRRSSGIFRDSKRLQRSKSSQSVSGTLSPSKEHLPVTGINLRATRSASSQGPKTPTTDTQIPKTTLSGEPGSQVVKALELEQPREFGTSKRSSRKTSKSGLLAWSRLPRSLENRPSSASGQSPQEGRLSKGKQSAKGPKIQAKRLTHRKRPARRGRKRKVRSG